MKKSVFEIITTSGKEYRSGLVSESFGIHKNQNGTYSVTHLNTGYKIFTFFLQKQARKFVESLEDQNILWGTLCEWDAEAQGFNLFID